jgi:hypothetical protein
MAKKKRTNNVKSNKSRLLDDINTAKAGDYCYFLNVNKKILWGEIQRVFKEEEKLILQIMEEKESRFYSIAASNCAFSEKIIKEIKGGK